MSLRKRSLLLGGAGLLVAPAPVRALAPPLYGIAADDLRRALEGGGTLVGYLDERLYVERYEPGGRLRGTYAGRAYEGRWRAEGIRLCTEVAPEPPLCVIVHGSSGDRMVDGVSLWLFREDGKPAMSARYHTRAPWQTRSPQMSARVRVNGSGPDSFGAVGTVAGLPPSFIVWTGRRVALRGDQEVLIHGTTDGVTFTAERVTQLDGSPMP